MDIAKREVTNAAHEVRARPVRQNAQTYPRHGRFYPGTSEPLLCVLATCLSICRYHCCGRGVHVISVLSAGEASMVVMIQSLDPLHAGGLVEVRNGLTYCYSNAVASM